MSEFTGGGFERTEKEKAEILSTPGSKHTDGIYRSARIEGFTQALSVLRVYLEGAKAGGHDQKLVTSDLVEKVSAIYSGEKAAGRHHGEAIDEVFLAGYVAAKAGAFA